MTTAKKNTKSKKKFNADTFYKRYKHVVQGSVKDVEVGSVVGGLTVVHPRICKIKCKESGKTRTIHTQDAHQVFYTIDVQAKKAREKAANRRKGKAKAAPKKKSTPKKKVKATPKKKATAKENGKAKTEKSKVVETKIESKPVAPPPPPPLITTGPMH